MLPSTTCPRKIAANWEARNDRARPGLPGFPRTPLRSQEVAHPRSRRGHLWRACLRRRIPDFALPVLPLLPVVLPVRGGTRRRVAGVADVAVHHWWRVGRHYPPPLRGCRAHAAVGCDDVP